MIATSLTSLLRQLKNKGCNHSHNYSIPFSMNNKDFITELAQRTGYTQDNTQKLVRCVIETMASYFDEGDNVSIPDLGTFELKNRMERIVVNPATGQRMMVPPKLVLNFKPDVSMKEMLKKGGTDDER